jgi:hypothetical protein
VEGTKAFCLVELKEYNDSFISTGEVKTICNQVIPKAPTTPRFVIWNGMIIPDLCGDVFHGYERMEIMMMNLPKVQTKVKVCQECMMLYCLEGD